MNIDLARKFDYYLGIPLCFIGTLILRPFAFRKRRLSRDPITRVLMIELSEMGSVILADPAMAKLKRVLNAELYFVIFRKNQASLRLLETVPSENIFVMEDSGFLTVAASTVRFFFWTRANGIDTVIDLELFSRFTALLAGFSGARSRVGFHAFHSEGLYRGDFLTHKVAYNPHLHIAKNFIALANALLASYEERPFSKVHIGDPEIKLRRVVIAPERVRKVLRKIGKIYPGFCWEKQRIILFNTNSSDLMPLRRWPRAYFVTLARLILEQYADTVILLTGSSDERADNERFVEDVGDARCHNFAGETAILELVALYSISCFMLTNDSGPAHFAAVTSMPTYTFFGPETPALYGSLGELTPIYSGLACSPCVSATNHRKSPCSDNTCLKIITPEQVLKMLTNELLSRKQDLC